MFLNSLLPAFLVFGQGAYALTSSTSPTSTTTSPIPTSCSVQSFPPFSLHAMRANGTTYPVRLYQSASTPNVTTMAVNTNAICSGPSESCGVIPTAWWLKDMKLYPLLTGASGYTTINQAVPAHSSPSFITTKKSVPTYPIYCAVTPGTATGAAILSVNGQDNQFSMCAWMAPIPPPTRFDIVYIKSGIQPVGEQCFNVTLVMKQIPGIDPPPTIIFDPPTTTIN